MIPRHVMYFWGNEKMSWLRYMTLVSCRYHNPDMKISLYWAPSTVRKRTWGEHNKQDFHNFIGEDYSEKIKDLNINIVEWEIPDPKLRGICASHKSNFFKWYTLGEDGGIYADMDILWIKPMDEIWQITKEYDTGLCNHVWLSIGLLTSAPNNRVYMDTYQCARKTYTPKNYQCVGVTAMYNQLCGPDWWKKGHNWDIPYQIGVKYPGNKVFNMPMSWVYHYNYRHLDKIFQETVTMPEEAFGIHWYAGNPLAQDYNNIMPGPENTISKYAKEML